VRRKRKTAAAAAANYKVVFERKSKEQQPDTIDYEPITRLIGDDG